MKFHHFESFNVRNLNVDNFNVNMKTQKRQFKHFFNVVSNYQVERRFSSTRDNQHSQRRQRILKDFSNNDQFFFEYRFDIIFDYQFSIVENRDSQRQRHEFRFNRKQKHNLQNRKYFTYDDFRFFVRNREDFIFDDFFDYDDFFLSNNEYVLSTYEILHKIVKIFNDVNLNVFQAH